MADEYENGSRIQPGGTGIVHYAESFYCVLMVEGK